MSDEETIKVEESEKKEEEEETAAAAIPKEQPLPPEVDAFFKGKNKYKHPYGNWRPVVKDDPLKRFVLISFVFIISLSFCFSKTIGEHLDLPTDNWYLPENQPEPIIQLKEDDSHVKLVFKEREITGIPSSSSSKTNETPVFKKRKTASNRQLRGSSTKDGHSKDNPDTN